MIAIALLVGALSLLYVWLKWNYSFWKRNNVLGPEPTLFVGNIATTFTFSEHWGNVTAEWYRIYSTEPYVGYYKMTKPAILVRDPDLINSILTTNFNSFRDNDFHLSKKFDPLLAANPFMVRDDEWRENRKQILPTFSQSKIKSMIPVMNGVGDSFIEFIESYPPNTDFNAKELAIRFATENVMKCTFSIDPGCFDKQNESEFLLAGKSMFAPSVLVGLKFFAIPILPKWVLDLIPVSFVSPAIDALFRKLIRINKASRVDGNQSHDILQMLLQTQAKHNFDDTHLAGHTLSLFVDGTETSSTALSYTLYELAVNVHCQVKLHEEISTITGKHDGKLSYEALHEMDYLEGVFLEALRKHSPLLVMAKTCTQKFTLPMNSRQSEPVTIYPGTIVNIPVAGVHMDSKNYPNPDTFLPERFYEVEQRKRHKGTFLGFGEGPRICPGMRFAIVQVKIALIKIIQNYHIKLSPNHKPIVIDPQTLLSYPKDGILIRLEPR